MTSVYVSSVLPAPVQGVWSLVRDFNGLPNWHPLVTDSRIEEDLPSSAVGCIRRFTQRGGAVVRERLEALDDRAYLQSYSIVQAPLPVSDYHATLQLWRVSDNDTTFATWTAQFNCASAEQARLITGVSTVFAEGFTALKALLRR